MKDDAVYRVWSGQDWVELPAVTMHDESLVVPNVNALLYPDLDRGAVLLQRRDKPGEVVRGKWELPGGRWRAGEPATLAVEREVLEETGIQITAIEAAGEFRRYHPNVAFEIVRPLAVVAGVEGSYPSIHVLFSCIGDGEPRAQPGETSDPTWWTLTDVEAALEEQPGEFVWHTRAMLEAAFGA